MEALVRDSARIDPEVLCAVREPTTTLLSKLVPYNRPTSVISADKTPDTLPTPTTQSYRNPAIGLLPPVPNRRMGADSRGGVGR